MGISGAEPENCKADDRTGRNCLRSPVVALIDVSRPLRCRFDVTAVTWSGKRSFAAFARALANLEEAAVHMAVELKNAAFDLMAAESPKLICVLLSEKERCKVHGGQILVLVAH